MKAILRTFLCIVAVCAITSLPVLADTTMGKGATAPEMSDTWIEAKLVTTYLLNRNLSLYDIDVDVRDQVAYLDGEVSNPIEKNLADEIAKSITGVKSVQNNINVVKTTKNRTQVSRNERSFGQVVSDLTTTASVKSKLLLDSNIDGLKINVDTFNDSVTLSGTVKSDAERQLAAKITENSEGVKSVQNKLVVSSQG